MNRHAYAALLAAAGLLIGAPGVRGDDAFDLSAPGGEAAVVADDQLAEIAGRQKRDDAEITLPRGGGDVVVPISPENAKIVVPLGEQAGGIAGSFAGQTATIFGLPVVGPNPGPTVGVAGFGVLGSAYRPNF